VGHFCRQFARIVAIQNHRFGRGGVDVSKPIEIESSWDLEDGGSMVLRNFRIKYLFYVV